MRSRLGRVTRAAGGWPRDLGLVPYRPERRSTAEWSREYRSGSLAYYEALDELGRYSIIAGYVGWLARGSATGRVSVLDVGCGTGVLRERLPDQHLDRYAGVDPSEAAIAQAGRRVDDRTSFVVGEIGSVEVAPADVVVLNEMLYYLPARDDFVERLDQLVEPGGAIVVSMWRHPGDRALWRRLDRTWTLVDRVEVSNRANAVNRRGWRVACYQP